MAARRKMTAEEARAQGFAPVEADQPVRAKMSAAEAADAGFAPVEEADAARVVQNSTQVSPTEQEGDLLAPKSEVGTAVRSFGKGGSLGFADELGGAMGAYDELGRRARAALGLKTDDSVPVENPNLSLRDALIARYRRERGDARAEQETGAAANPKLAAGAELVGSLAAPISGPGKAKGVASLVKYGAKLGAASGFGNSSADLTKGEVGQAIGDTGIGAGVGAGTGLATAPLQMAGSKLSGLMRREAQGVRAGKYDQLADAADKEIASLKGEFGAATQAGSRANENVTRAVVGVGDMGAATVDPATQRRALLALSDPKFKELADSVATNTLDSVGEKLANIERTKAAYQDALATRDSKIGNQLKDYFSKSSLKTDVLPRVGRQLTNTAIGALGGAAIGAPLAAGGALLGYDPGKVFSGSVATGAAMAAAPGSGLKTMMRNLANNPRAQNAALTTLEGAIPASTNTFTKSLASQATQVLRRPKDEKDEDAVSAWLHSGF